MTNIKCESCGHELDQEETICPSCGNKIKKNKSIITKIKEIFTFKRNSKKHYEKFCENKQDLQSELDYFNNFEYIDDETKKKFQKDNKSNYEFCCKLKEYANESKINLDNQEDKLITDFIDKYDNLDEEVKKINESFIKKQHNQFKKDKEKYKVLIDKYEESISYENLITNTDELKFKKDFEFINKLLSYESSDNYDFADDKEVLYKLRYINNNFKEIKKTINNEVNRRKTIFNDLKNNKKHILDFINKYKNNISDDLYINDFQLILNKNKDYLEICNDARDIYNYECIDEFIELYDDFANVSEKINENYFNRLLDSYFENKSDLLIQIEDYKNLDCETYVKCRDSFISKYNQIYVLLTEIFDLYENHKYKLENEDSNLILNFINCFENLYDEFPYSVYSKYLNSYPKIEPFVSTYEQVKDCSYYIHDKNDILKDYAEDISFSKDIFLLKNSNLIELTRREYENSRKFNQIYETFDEYIVKHNKCHINELKNKFNINKDLISDFIKTYNFNSNFNYYIDDDYKNDLKESNKENYDLICQMMELDEITNTKLMSDFINSYENIDEIILSSNKKFVSDLYIKNKDSITKYSTIMESKQDYYVSNAIVNSLHENYDKVLNIVNDLLDYCSQYEYLENLNELNMFPKSFSQFEDFIGCANESYIERELENSKEFFDNVVPGKPLDSNQRKAVIIDEDNTQIIAGAGCGKTLTLQAKAKYLIEKKHVNPDEILAISFSKLSANDLKYKMSEIGLNMDISTFHALGLKTLSENNLTPNVLEYGLKTAIKKYFLENVINNSKKSQEIIEYLAYYINVPLDKNKISSIGEVYDYERGMDLETFQSKFNKLKYSNDDSYDENNNELDEESIYDEFKKLRDPTLEKTTLHGEKVNSLEERKIANFLFINGVNYTYEKQWKPKYDWEKFYNFLDKYLIIDSIPEEFRKGLIYELLDFLEVDEEIYWRKKEKVERYCPDFYLDDYDIYYEHFGVNRDCLAPWLPKKLSLKYRRSLKNKRILHKKYGTKLIETYSYYQSENRLLDRLGEKLKEYGVKLNPINYQELLKDLLNREKKINEYYDLIKLIETFINLFKGNGYDKIKFKEFRKDNENLFSGEFKERHDRFFDIVEDIYDYYHDFLKKENAIDFNDMINHATEFVKENGFYKNYKYIMVDEFQDTSHTRFNFLKSIKDNTNAKLIVVGDDWQSIYRFTGCDIDLFTNFSDYFDNAKTEICYITNTYRNSQNLIDVSGNFIMKNTAQFKKQLNSKLNNQIADCVKLYQYYNYEMQPFIFEKMINDIYKSSNKNKVKILVLGRNRKDFKRILNEKLFYTTGSVENKNLKIHYKKNPGISIDYMTVHGSKGLEEDNVILINLEDSKNGFPNKIEDDSVLNFVKNKKTEPIEFAEERRLFYVALTRTKERTFLLASKDKKSIFVDEIFNSIEVFNVEKDFEDGGIKDDKIHVMASTDSNCPYCGTGNINLKHNPKTGKKWFNCSNWPRCDWFGGTFYGDINELDNPQYCPKCGGLLIKKRNSRTGEYFYSCINYFPNKACRYTRNI